MILNKQVCITVGEALKAFFKLFFKGRYVSTINSNPNYEQLSKSFKPQLIPMTEEEEYRNAGITKEEINKNK